MRNSGFSSLVSSHICFVRTSRHGHSLAKHTGIRFDMRRRHFTIAVCSPLVPIPLTATAGVTEPDAASAIRTALQRGAVSAVNLLGRTDGFLGNPQVRIRLPGALERAAQFLRLAGQSQHIDELVTAMNRAAEAA